MKKAILIALIFLISLNIFSQKSVLLLYKDSEKYGLNMLKNYVIPILEKWNLDYDLKNVETLNPYDININNYFGVISWYYSTTNIQYPKLYLRQISELLDNGGFFFFFNNLGVSINSSEVNNVLNKIGVHYTGGFKELENYSLEYQDEFFLKEPDYHKMPVEKYIVFGKNTNILLTVYSNEIYPMIFLSKNGGGAVFTSFIEENGSVILDIEKILDYLLNIKVGLENKILIVKNNYDENPYSKIIFNLQKTFDYARLDYDLTNTNEFYNLSYFDLLPYKYIIWNSSSEYIENYSTKKFVENGGTIIFITTVFNTPWSKVSTTKNNTYSKVIFSKKIFPLSNIPESGIEFEKYFNVDYEVNLEKEEILAYFQNKNGEKLPAIWYLKQKSGSIGYINPSLVLKETRGIILQSIMEMQDVAISAIINSYTFMLDDFPLPSYNIIRLTIDNKKISDDEFYYRIWWPQLKEFSKKYQIKLSTFVALNYNAKTQPPFEFSEFLLNYNSTIKTLREIADSPNIELGLHGYNHIPLTKENWENPDNIIKATKNAKIFLENVIGHPITLISYVAPNNIIDEYGIKYLLKGHPEIRLIGTRYEGSEFFTEYNIIDKTLILPRSVYGYYPASKMYFNLINTLANFGAFQYYIHPDDAFDKNRNPDNLSWDKMYTYLENLYDNLKNFFPWLRNQSISETYKSYFDYFTTSIKYYQENNKIYVSLPDNSYFPRFFWLKSKNKIESINGGEIIYNYKDNNIYVIQMDTPILEINLGEENE